MLICGQAMFLLVPNPSNKKVLAPGKVTESGPESFVIEFEEEVKLAAGLETLAYCEVRGKFFQQGTTLIEIRETPGKPVYHFQRVGEPVSAEQRQTFRVSVAISMIYAQFGQQKKCHVVDFSPEGLGIIASPGYEIGSRQSVSIRFDDYILDAEARIQTVKALPSGKIRYGLLVDKTNVAARKTLQKITVTFQRNQLKRLAGAA